MGGDLNSFHDIKPFIKWWCGACSDTQQGTTWSVLLNGSYHMKHEYIWFMGKDLNSFQDIKPFMKWWSWGMPRHALGEHLLLNVDLL